MTQKGVRESEVTRLRKTVAKLRMQRDQLKHDMALQGRIIRSLSKTIGALMTQKAQEKKKATG